MQQLKLSSNTAKLHQMFGKRLYSDKFSFVSEICQNAVDSHRMSGQTKPVEVGIYDKSSSYNTSYTFYVRDIGLSFEDKEDFIKKVCTILESGKSENKTNDENCAMGMHGIGSISVSAFNSEWRYTIITPNKKKFKATLKEQEGIGLTYELSDYEDTDEEKSVLFEVEVPQYSNINSFINGVKAKLCYFKDIMFKFSPNVIKSYPQCLTLNTEFKIFESEDFQYSTINNNQALHISVDQYSYHIRWDVLGMDSIQNFPIALKFGLGDGLTPDITRENLLVDDNYKKIVLDKLKRVAEWFVNRYNSSVPDEGFTSLELYDRCVNSGRHITIPEISTKVNFPIGSFSKMSKISIKKPKMKGVSDEILDNFKENLGGGKGMFSLVYEVGNKGTLIKRDGSSWRSFSYNTNILLDINLDKKRSAYLKTKYPGAGLYSIKKLSNRRYLESYYKIPKKLEALDEYKKTGVNIYREIYNEYKLLYEYFIKESLIKLSSIEIPKDQKPTIKKTYISTRKERFDPQTLSGEVNLKFAENLTRAASDYCCKFTDKVTPVKDLFKIRNFVIYGKNEDRVALDRLHRLTNYVGAWESKSRVPNNNIRICMVGDTDFKVLNKLNLHNFMEVKDFTQGKHRFFGDVMTAYLIQRDVIKKYNRIIEKRGTIKNYISEGLYSKIENLLAYVKRYRPDAYIDSYRYNENDQFTKDLLSIFHEKKLRNEVIWEDAQYVLNNIHKVEAVQYFTEGMIDSKQIGIVQDIAKYRKFKLDLKHYKSNKPENLKENDGEEEDD
jgi:hypothetical protein